MKLSSRLNEDYPAKSRPQFKLRCRWLQDDQVKFLKKIYGDCTIQNIFCEHSQLKMLSELLERLDGWSSGEVVLFRWHQLLREEAMSALGIIASGDSNKVPEVKVPRRVAFEELLRLDQDSNATTASGQEAAAGAAATVDNECLICYCQLEAK